MSETKHDIRLAIIREAKKERDAKTLYKWGGVLDKHWGTDCSGLVVGIWRRLALTPAGYDSTADNLRRACPHTTTPKGGDLCFFGKKGRATHVTIFVGEGECIGANGGGRWCVDPLIARLAKAWVKQVSAWYRKDFLGFGSIDWLLKNFKD